MSRDADMITAMTNVGRYLRLEKYDTSVLSIIGPVQKSGVRGIHFVQWSRADEWNLTTCGKPVKSWVYEDDTLLEIDYPGEQKFASMITSDYPRFNWAAVSEGHYVIWYVCGPRASRAFLATIDDSRGSKHLNIAGAEIRIS